MRLLQLLLVLMVFISCGDDNDSSVQFRGIQGIESADLKGGVVLYATDGIEILSHTFGSGDHFENSEIRLASGREWKFRVFAWEGLPGGSPGPQNNFRGKIRCGSTKLFLEPGENPVADLEIRESECFNNIFSGAQLYSNAGLPHNKFHNIKIFGCKGGSFDPNGTLAAFLSSSCNNNSNKYGISNSFRVIIDSLSPEGPSGLQNLVSNCFHFNRASGNNGTILNMNLPLGYSLQTQDGLPPLGFAMRVATFSGNNCTDKTKDLVLFNGFLDADKQFIEPGKEKITPFASHVNGTTNIYYAFKDELPPAPPSGTEFIFIGNTPFVSGNDLVGGCAPAGATIELHDVGLSNLVGTTTCSANNDYQIAHGLATDGNYVYEARLLKEGGGHIFFNAPFTLDNSPPTFGGIGGITCSGSLDFTLTTASCNAASTPGGPHANIPADEIVYQITDAAGNVIIEKKQACTGSASEIVSDTDSNVTSLCSGSNELWGYLIDAAGNISGAFTSGGPI